MSEMVTEAKFVPAWKDKEGNRFVVVAMNHVFDSFEDAQRYQCGEFLCYVPFGWSPAGIEEIPMVDGKASFPHVPATGPYEFPVAVIEGPLFDAALSED